MMKFNNGKVSMAYERVGRGTPLVLIHGFPLDHTIWDEVVPLLQDDFDLILPDLRGFGESDALDAPYTMDDLAGDIASLLDHLGLEAASLAGHSMGGYVALAFAAAYRVRVHGLALVASQAAADVPERKAARYATIEQIREKGTGVVVESMAPKLSPDEWVQKYVRNLMKKQSAEGMIGSLKAMAERADTVSMLAATDFPLLLVHGDADALIPVDRACELQIAVPRARMIELPKVGHMPMMEAPREVTDALKGLFR